MFCKYCGQPVQEGAAVCTGCGKPAAQPQPYYTTQSASTDSGSFGWWVLGFFFPLVGLILFLVWQKSKPLSAKRAGIGALVGFITGIVLTLLVLVLFGWVIVEILDMVMEDRYDLDFSTYPDGYFQDYGDFYDNQFGEIPYQFDF